MDLKEFQALLKRVRDGFPTNKDFADALGIDPSRVSRAINHGDYPLNVENCLRLAKLSGESASTILRAANHADIVPVIESLYGRERNDLLTDEERDVLDIYTALTTEKRQSWRTLLKQDEQRQRRKTAKSPRFQRAAVPDHPRKSDHSGRGPKTS